MKKLFLVPLVLLGISTLAFAGESGGNPFQAIWDAISDLQEQINNIQLMPDPQGPQDEPGPAGSSLHLYDASGQNLGTLASAQDDGDFGYRYTSYIKSGNNKQGILFSFRNRDSRNPISSWENKREMSPLYFTQIECEGEAFIGFGQYFKPEDIYSSPNYVSYFIVRPDTRGTRQARSRLTNTGCGNFSGEDTNTYLIANISLPFTEPLAWPLRVREN